ncbi:MAG: hypothetical protein ACE5EX_09860 [Phycisphaerae bacterium]
MTDEQRKLLEEARSVANDRNYDIQRLVRYMLHRLIDIINEQELTIQELKSATRSSRKSSNGSVSK